ncbi:DNA-methyltransferase [Gordonia sp. SND2]|uniref:DNA-methyltransferase n=1 Tax=Gordonia sp. SND2 TaxID=3388659 RepID=UPI00398A785C
MDRMTAGVKDQQVNDRWAIYNADCIDILAGLPDNALHGSIYSPPFAGLYQYSSNDRDLSNARTYEEFCAHYAFVVREKFRATIPGRTSGVHAAPVPTGNTGRDGLRDFPGDVIRIHQAAGWEWVARHAIWKEPLAVRNRTMQKNLSHKTICDDGAMGGVASADELLIFRKPGQDAPVIHECGLINGYAGSEPIPAELLKFRGHEGDQKANRYSHWIWRRYASSVWDDIRLDRVLPFRYSRDEDDEAHVHPLQLDVIERYLDLRTLPGETVLTPFMGVGSEVYAAVQMGRRAIGAELKPSYFEQAIRNMAAVDDEKPAKEEALFDFEDAS